MRSTIPINIRNNLSIYGFHSPSSLHPGTRNYSLLMGISISGGLGPCKWSSEISEGLTNSHFIESLTPRFRVRPMLGAFAGDLIPPLRKNRTNLTILFQAPFLLGVIVPGFPWKLSQYFLIARMRKNRKQRVEVAPEMRYRPQKLWRLKLSTSVVVEL